MNAAPHPAYNNAAQTLMRKIVQGAREAGLAPQTVANVALRTVQQPKPKLRYSVGNIARFVPVFKVLCAGHVRASLCGGSLVQASLNQWRQNITYSG